MAAVEGYLSQRWVFVARSLWMEILFDGDTRSDVNVCIDMLTKFLDVLEWRAGDRISETDFIALYQHWCERVAGNGVASSASSSGGKRSANSGGVPEVAFRSLLLERGYQDTDLDIMFGLLVNVSCSLRGYCEHTSTW
jgi:hypothetical protein